MTHSKANAKDGASPASKTRLLLLKLRCDPAQHAARGDTLREAARGLLSWRPAPAGARRNGACEAGLVNGLESRPRLGTLIACFMLYLRRKIKRVSLCGLKGTLLPARYGYQSLKRGWVGDKRVSERVDELEVGVK